VVLTGQWSFLQEMADMMKNMFQSGSDGQAAAGMFGDMPFPFPGQPPEKEAVPDAEKLLQQLQAMMAGRASPAGAHPCSCMENSTWTA